MTHSVIWLSEAIASYRRLRATDPDGARRIAKVVTAPATDPRPADSNALGGTSFRRIRLDRYRVLYEVTDDTVRVMHVGRVIARPIAMAQRGTPAARRQPKMSVAGGSMGAWQKSLR